MVLQKPINLPTTLGRNLGGGAITPLLAILTAYFLHASLLILFASASLAPSSIILYPSDNEFVSTATGNEHTEQSVPDGNRGRDCAPAIEITRKISIQSWHTSYPYLPSVAIRRPWTPPSPGSMWPIASARSRTPSPPPPGLQARRVDCAPSVDTATERAPLVGATEDDQLAE